MTAATVRAHASKAALPLLLAFLGGWGLWAILLDQQPEYSDALVEDSVQLHRALSGSAPAVTAVKTGYRPPLCHLPAALLFLITGPGLALLRLTFLLQYLGIVYVSYSIGRYLAGRQAGLLAAVMVGTFPAIFGWGRMPYMDVGLGLMLLVTLRVLLGCDFTRLACGLHLGTAVGLGLLTKVAYPAFAIGALLWTVVFRLRRARHLATLGLAAATTIAIAGWWYALNWRLVVTNIGMSSASPTEAVANAGTWTLLAHGLRSAGEKLVSYTVEVDGAVWLLLLALLGSLAAWRLRTVARPALALLNLTVWLSLAAMLLFHQSRRYVLPVYMVAGTLAGTSLQTVLLHFGRRRLTTIAAAVISAFLLGDFVSINLGRPVYTRPRTAYKVGGPRVDGLGLLSPDRRPLDTFPQVLGAIERRGGRCLFVYTAGEVRERQYYREQVLQLRAPRPLPISHRLDEYLAETPGSLCVVLVSRGIGEHQWAEHAQTETGLYDLCLAYAWFRQAPVQRELGHWGPSPVGLIYTLYELGPETREQKTTPPAYCRFRQIFWEELVHPTGPR